LRRSAIKQVLAALALRQYMINRDDLQIKIAQGQAGEGGAIAGHKVDDFIAVYAIRSWCGPNFSASAPRILFDRGPGAVIFDLKNVNPKARISVNSSRRWGRNVLRCGEGACRRHPHQRL